MCKKKSITFDPFMYLSLPLPSTTMRTMTLTLLSNDGTTLPSPITVTVPKCGRLKDLLGALSSACSLRDDETLRVVEVCCYSALRYHDCFSMMYLEHVCPAPLILAWTWDHVNVPWT